MARDKPDARVRLDLNNPVFQEGLFGLEKPERLAALDTLGKSRRVRIAYLCTRGGRDRERDAYPTAGRREPPAPGGSVGSPSAQASRV